MTPFNTIYIREYPYLAIFGPIMPHLHIWDTSIIGTLGLGFWVSQLWRFDCIQIQKGTYHLLGNFNTYAGHQFACFTPTQFGADVLLPWLPAVSPLLFFFFSGQSLTLGFCFPQQDDGSASCLHHHGNKNVFHTQFRKNVFNHSKLKSKYSF